MLYRAEVRISVLELFQRLYCCRVRSNDALRRFCAYFFTVARYSAVWEAELLEQLSDTTVLQVGRQLYKHLVMNFEPLVLKYFTLCKYF
jgi:hypothetical protein